MVDTEVYAYQDFTDSSDFPFNPEEQMAWLEADLVNANKNRDRTPWIVMTGHKG
jgi:formiminotetrahydrofolate cyclodeaminase